MNGSIAYVQRSVSAVVRLALRDAQAMSLLDMTADGFYRSFAAMIVAAPLYAACIVGWQHLLYVVATTSTRRQFDPAELEFSARDFVLSVVLYVLLWAVFPLVILFVLRFLNMTARYSALIIAYNWSSIVVIPLFGAPLALLALGVLAPFPVVALLFTSFGFALYYRFFVALAALQSGASAAMAASVINVIIFFFLIFGSEMLSHALGP